MNVAVHVCTVLHESVTVHVTTVDPPHLFGADGLPFDTDGLHPPLTWNVFNQFENAVFTAVWLWHFAVVVLVAHVTVNAV